jgi:hypothetical protein
MPARNFFRESWLIAAICSETKRSLSPVSGRLLPNGKLLSDKDQTRLEANLTKAERINECAGEESAFPGWLLCGIAVDR